MIKKLLVAASCGGCSCKSGNNSASFGFDQFFYKMWHAFPDLFSGIWKQRIWTKSEPNEKNRAQHKNAFLLRNEKHHFCSRSFFVISSFDVSHSWTHLVLWKEWRLCTFFAALFWECCCPPPQGTQTSHESTHSVFSGELDPPLLLWYGKRYW